MRTVSHTFLPAPPLPPGRPRLVLAGPMGTGKTEGGRKAARLLGLPFVDLDEVVERRAMMAVADIFTLEGEVGFRRREREAVLDAARLSGVVAATGGGAPLDALSFGRLADGAVVVPLAARAADIERRLDGAQQAGRRPLLSPDPSTRIRSLLEERALLYAALGEPLDTSDHTLEELGVRLAAMYPGGTSGPVRIPVEGPEGIYELLVGERVGDLLGRELERLFPEGTTAAVVADASVEAGLDRLTRGLTQAGLDVRLRIRLPPGEAAKSAAALADLWARFADAGLDRSSVVVAVGGGAALDTAGFAAATYARGVSLVNVPTTLLAMVDAAIGGKVAIDHAGIKNLVGAFHHPRLVVADVSVLDSLPAPVLRSGIAECVKAAVLAAPLVLDILDEATPDPSLGGSGSGWGPSLLAWVVEQAARVKAAYVAVDPGDHDVRHCLNLGHTFAHGIEAATEHAVPHGDAVAVGLLAAARLGTRAGITPPALGDRLAGLLSRLGLPTCPPEGLDRARVAAAMAGDKKRRKRRSVFVVPASWGAALLHDVPAEDALEALFVSGRRGP